MPLAGDRHLLREMGWRAYDRRHRLGLTQERVAEAAGVERREVGRLERGERNPTALMLLRLARALGTTTDWLLTGEGEDRWP